MVTHQDVHSHQLHEAWERVVSFLTRRDVPLSHAEDLASDAVEIVLKERKNNTVSTLPENPENLRAWMCRVALRDWLDHMRSLDRHPETDIDAHPLSSQPVYRRVDMTIDLDIIGRQTFGNSWEDKKELFHLHRKGFTSKEIAQLRRERGESSFISETSVTSQFFRIRRRMQAGIETPIL